MDWLWSRFGTEIWSVEHTNILVFVIILGKIFFISKFKSKIHFSKHVYLKHGFIEKKKEKQTSYYTSQNGSYIEPVISFPHASLSFMHNL